MSCADSCQSALGPLPKTGDGVQIPWGCDSAGNCVAGGCTNNSDCTKLSGCLSCGNGYCVPKKCKEDSECPEGSCISGICVQDSETYGDLPWVILALLIIILVVSILTAIIIYYYRDKLRKN